MRSPILLLFLLFGAYSLSAQDVSNVVAKHSDGKVTVSYDLDTSVPAYFVELTFSKDGGITFSEPLKRVSGDANNVASGSSKRIIWDAASEIGYFNGDMIFRVNAEVRSKKMPDIIESEKFNLELKSIVARNSKLYATLILTPKADKFLIIYENNSGIINSKGETIQLASGVFSSSNQDRVNAVTNLPLEIKFVFENYQPNLTMLPRLYTTIGVRFDTYDFLFENVPVTNLNP